MYQVFFLFIFIRFSTAVHVGGEVLLQNTIWTKHYNPYNVIGDIFVPKNVTLIIESGVKIVFHPNADFEMLIKGFLQVHGTRNQPVIFDGSQSKDHKKWMLTFKATNLSHSSVKYARFLGPKRAVQLADIAGVTPINTGEVIFQYCQFSHTETGIMAITSNQWTFVDVPVLTIKNSTMTNSTITNNFNAPQLMKLIGTNLANMTINLMGGYRGIRMLECSGENISISLGYTSEKFIEINDTKLRNVAIRLTNPTYGFRSNVIIKGSILLNASILMIVYDLDPLQNYVYILSSELTVPQPLELELGLIEHSSISSFDLNSNSTGIISRSISISQSSIYNFETGLRVLPYKIPMGNITNTNFYKNNMYNIENLGDNDIEVVGNWWGTKSDINNKLFDYWDNINYGEIKHIDDALEFIH